MDLTWFRKFDNRIVYYFETKNPQLFWLDLITSEHGFLDAPGFFRPIGIRDYEFDLALDEDWYSLNLKTGEMQKRSEPVPEQSLYFDKNEYLFFDGQWKDSQGLVIANCPVTVRDFSTDGCI